jgi:hypothetical protein
VKILCWWFLALISSVCASARVGPDLGAGIDVAFFTRLRLETAAQKDYEPIWSINEERKAIMEARKKGKIDAVLQLAEPWLTKLPIDADIHLVVAMAYKEKGDLPSYCYHLCVFNGLLASITSTGDGLSEESAFNVVSVDEEYSLVREIGGKVTEQRLVGKCDRLEVERNGKQLTLFFDASEHFKALRRTLQGG